MGSRSGTYSQFLFDEEDRYLGILMQEGVSVVDADLNNAYESFIAQIRRAIQFGIGDGSPNTGWKIEESVANNINNFTIKGGDGTIEGAGWIFEDGLQAIIPTDIEYDSANTDIHPQITALTDTVLTDTSADYITNELVGRDLVPDINFPGTTFSVLSNTTTTITVASGLLAASAVGDHYRMNLSTPGGPRTDTVFLDLYLDEVDSVEDPSLIHTITTGPAEAARRLKLRTYIKVAEGVAASVDFVDADGNQHFPVTLATFSRGVLSTVVTAQITDNRGTVSLVSPLTVQEQDGSPLITEVTTLKFTNDTVTDEGGGIVSIVTGGGASGSETRSLGISLFTDVSGGDPAPTAATMGEFKVLDFPDAVDNEVKFQFNLPVEWRDAAADNVEIRPVFALSGNGDGTDVIIEIEGSIQNTTVITAATTAISTTGISANEATLGPIVRTISDADIDDNDEIVLRFKRLGTDGGDGFTADFRLLSVIVQFVSSVSEGQIFSISFQQFSATDEPSPTQSTMSLFDVVDYDPDTDQEAKVQFNVPTQLETGNLTIRAKFAMSNSNTGVFKTNIEGSINNTSSFGPITTIFDPVDAADTLEIVNIGTFAVVANDEILLKVKRLASDVADTHTGNWRLSSIFVEFTS